YFTRVKAASIPLDKGLSVLEADIGAYGPAHEQVRQSAFCGLTVLGRLSLMKDRRETIGDAEPLAVAVNDYMRENRPFARFVANNWRAIERGLGPDVLRRIGGKRPDLARTLDRLCAHAAGKEFREMLKESVVSNDVLSPNIL